MGWERTWEQGGREQGVSGEDVGEDFWLERSV